MTIGRDGFIPPYMDAPTLAEHICCSVQTIDNWVKAGIFPPPSKHIMGKRLWSWSEVNGFLTTRCGTPESSDISERIRNATKTAVEAAHEKRAASRQN